MALSARMAARVREMDARLSDRPPPEVAPMLARVFTAKRRQTHRRIVASTALVAATGAIVFWLAGGSAPAPDPSDSRAAVSRAQAPPPTSPPTKAKPVREDALQISGSCASQQHGERFSLDGECLVASLDPSLRMHSRGSAVLQRRRKGFDVLHGRITFDVDAVLAGGSPVRVGVGTGLIEVVGTMFVVDVDGSDGYVDLIDGMVRFRDANEEWHDLEPGGRLQWENGLVKEPEQSPRLRPTGKATPEHAIPEDLDDVLDRVTRLRSARRYGEALDELDRLRRRVSEPRTAETLSFERATVVELSRSEDACAEWKRHLQEHPAGRHARLAERRRGKLGCK